MITINIENEERSNVIEICKDAVQYIKGRVVRVNEEQGIIHGKKSWSLFSFGQNIYINISHVGYNHYSISISLEQAYEIQLFDWGTNNENEEAIAQYIENYFGS